MLQSFSNLFNLFLIIISKSLKNNDVELIGLHLSTEKFSFSLSIKKFRAVACMLEISSYYNQLLNNCAKFFDTNFQTTSTKDSPFISELVSCTNLIFLAYLGSSRLSTIKLLANTESGTPLTESALPPLNDLTIFSTSSSLITIGSHL